jgi:hypothetical protein
VLYLLQLTPLIADLLENPARGNRTLAVDIAEKKKGQWEQKSQGEQKSVINRIFHVDINVSRSQEMILMLITALNALLKEP